MSLAQTVQSVDVDLRKKEIIVKVAASGNYVAGGDTLNLTATTNPNNKTDGKFGYPGNIEDFSVEQAPAGYGAELVPGATLATWKLKVFTTSNTELAAGAYPAAITGDFFYLRFKGPKLQL